MNHRALVLICVAKLVLIVSLIPMASNAASCDEFRLDSAGMPGENLKVKNQGDSGLCYAFTASYLIDFMKIRNGQTLSFESSPLAISVDYKRDGLLGGLFRGRSLNGGFTCKAIKATEETFSRTVGTKIFEEKKFEEFTKEGKILFSKYKKDSLTEKSLSLFLSKYFNQVDQIYLEKGLKSYKKFIQSLVKTISRESHEEEATNLRCDSIKIKKKKGFNNQLNNELMQGKAVGVSYCSRVLYAKRLKIKRCGPHASVLIGQRVKKGICQVLIQNSWGKSCAPYDWDCENGKVWVDKSKLEKEILSIVKVNYN